MGFAFRDIISSKRQKHNLSLQQVWHMVIYCSFAGWPIYWIKYFSRFSRFYSIDYSDLELTVKLVVSQIAPCHLWFSSDIRMRLWMVLVTLSNHLFCPFL